jgi:dipeptidyl aminopeptidase/acylaminoacyl peptidase
MGAPLIPREKFLGNPSKSLGRISPDGAWLSWVAPRDGVLNIWMAPASDPAAGRPLTDERVRPIRQYFWSPDSRQLLFINDKGGDENFLLYGIKIESGQQRLLTPFEKTRVQIIRTSREIKDRILVGINDRDARWHDVQSLDLASGKLTPVLINNGGYASFVADRQLQVRAATRPRSDGGSDFFRVLNNEVEQEPFEQVALEDSLTTAPVGFTADGSTLYWRDSRGRNTAALIAQDVATGRKTLVAENRRADIGSALVHPRTGRLEAYAVNYLKTEWVPIDGQLEEDLDFLRVRLKGEINILSRTDEDDKWVVSADPVHSPAAAYLYDREARNLTRLYVTRPELEGEPLAAMHPVEIRTRDGLTMVSYLTLPAGSDSRGSGRPERPLPMMLLVHGGPWARDSFGFNASAQWLANRGYAVLAVNFRGSTGFGKGFISAGDLEWGRKMHNDLLDAVEWAVREGIGDQDRVAIMGGSYGGYATLAGLAFTPETFACGVDIVGPSNLNTLLKTIPPYWEAGKSLFYKRMGDPTTPKDRRC